MTPEEMSTYNQRLAAFTRLLDFVHAGNLPRINEASQLGQDVGGPRTRVWPGDGWCFRAWASGWPKILKQMTRWPGSIFAENINNGVAKTTNDPVKYIHINIYIYILHRSHFISAQKSCHDSPLLLGTSYSRIRCVLAPRGKTTPPSYTWATGSQLFIELHLARDTRQHQQGLHAWKPPARGIFSRCDPP